MKKQVAAGGGGKGAAGDKGPKGDKGDKGDKGAPGGLGEPEREELINEVLGEHHRLNNEERYVNWPGLEFVLDPVKGSTGYLIEKMQHLCRHLGVEAFGVTECALLNPGSGE